MDNEIPKTEPQEKKSVIYNAYSKNIRTLAYRLSELVFGSLIAAYILGFMSSSFRYVDVFIINEMNLLEIIFLISMSVVTSFLFSFFTAYVYYSYHTTVLRNPHGHAANTVKDFAIPLYVAIGFGVSAIYPTLIPGILFILLGLILWRNTQLCSASLEDLLSRSSEWNKLLADDKKRSLMLKYNF